MLTKEILLKKNPKYKNIEDIQNLNLWGCDLENISILSQCKKLEILSLSLNNISKLSPITKCVNLRELYLRKNNISSLSQIDYLKNLYNLRILWLDENPISNLENYKDYIVNNLPQLIKLDNVPIIKNRNLKRNQSSKKIIRRNTKLNDKKFILRRVNSNEPSKFNLLISGQKRDQSSNENFSFLKFNNIVSNDSSNNLTELMRQNFEKRNNNKIGFKKLKLRIVPKEIKQGNKHINKIIIKNIYNNKEPIQLKIPMSQNNSHQNIFKTKSIDKSLMVSCDVSTLNNEENIKKKKMNLLEKGIKLINKMNIKDLFILKQRIEEKLENNIKFKNN